MGHKGLVYMIMSQWANKLSGYKLTSFLCYTIINTEMFL